MQTVSHVVTRAVNLLSSMMSFTGVRKICGSMFLLKITGFVYSAKWKKFFVFTRDFKKITHFPVRSSERQNHTGIFFTLQILNYISLFFLIYVSLTYTGELIPSNNTHNTHRPDSVQYLLEHSCCYKSREETMAGVIRKTMTPNAEKSKVEKYRKAWYRRKDWQGQSDGCRVMERETRGYWLETRKKSS